MILLDTNTLLLLLIGLINPDEIKNQARLSVFEASDFYRLLEEISDFSKVVILPNIWTEIDNLLKRNRLRNSYIQLCKELTKKFKENYIQSEIGFGSHYVHPLGLTDVLILEQFRIKKATLFSIDSYLCDVARANNIQVVDLLKEKNDLFRK